MLTRSLRFMWVRSASASQNPVHDAVAPPLRTTSRSTAAQPGSPQRSHSGSSHDAAAYSPQADSPDRTFTFSRSSNRNSGMRLRDMPVPPSRTNSAHQGSLHRRSSASSRDSRGSRGSKGSRSSRQRGSHAAFSSGVDSAILNELNSAIGAALENVGHSPRVRDDATPDMSPNINDVTSSKSSPAIPQVSNRSSLTTVDGRFHHKRASSDTLPASPTLPSYPTHRRVSSQDVSKSSLLPSTHRRVSSNLSINSHSARQPPSRPSHLPTQIESVWTDELMEKIAALRRLPPLPPAMRFKDDIRRCRSAGERATVYASKMNELRHCASGLDLWILVTKDGSIRE